MFKRFVFVPLLAVLLIVSMVIPALAQSDSEPQVQQQASIGLASMALRELDAGNQDRAVLLALEALEHYPYTSQAEGALADIVEAYVPHSGMVPTAWSPAGDRFATVRPLQFEQDTVGGFTEELVIMEAGTEAELLLLSPESMVPGCSFGDMTWSPDGNRLVSAFRRGYYVTEDCIMPASVWDLNTGEQVLQLAGHEGQMLAVDWSPDGASIVTTSADGTARIWDAETGAERLAITGHTASVNDAVWSPDSSMVATASADATLRIWDAASGAEKMVVTNHTGGVTGVDWSPDGTWIASASADGTAHIWDAVTGDVVLNLIGHTAPLNAVQFAPDGRQIATFEGLGTARIWDAATGVQIGMLLDNLEDFYDSQIWSPDGVKLGNWDVSGLPLVLSGHVGGILNGEWSPDGTLIATFSDDNTARIWDAASGEMLQILSHPSMVFYSDWAPDGMHVVTACVDGKVRIWDVLTGEVASEWAAAEPEAFLFEVSWSPDGSRIFTQDITSVSKIWDASSGETVATLDFSAVLALLGPEEEFCVVFGPSWSPDSSKIATGCTANLAGTGPLIWDAATGELLQALPDVDGTKGAALRVAWSPDGTKLASGHTADIEMATSGFSRVWDLATGEVLQTFAGGGYAVSWSPDSTRIAVNSDGPMMIWDVATGKAVRSVEVPGWTLNTNWSPDGSQVMAVGFYNTPVIRNIWSSTQALIDEAYECCVTRELFPEERARFGLPPAE